jgi:hypothetical protein
MSIAARKAAVSAAQIHRTSMEASPESLSEDS